MCQNQKDNQMIADCIKDIHSNSSPDIVIIVSGDGDFVPLVKTLHELDKKVIILAQRGNVKQKLKQLADEFHFLDTLPQLVEGMTQRRTDSAQCQIAYNKAIEYLIEAIKTASSKGKRTVLGCIDRLMRQLFPDYQGVASIRTIDGKKFSKFSKFVAFVVAEGKIGVRNLGKSQELVLI
jgi:NYN domain